MGISNSWFAIQGASADEAISALGLERDREIGDHWPGHALAVAALPGGWTLIVHPSLYGAFGEEFVALSKRGPAVACSVEEHVMYQEARGYRDGAEVWRVVHDPEKGESLFHLEVTGAPPAPFEEMRRNAVAQQEAEGGEDADVDLISDVPLDLAKSICGFKHDDAWPPGLSFTTVRRVRGAPGKSSGGGFFARLFGGR